MGTRSFMKRLGSTLLEIYMIDFYKYLISTKSNSSCRLLAFSLSVELKDSTVKVMHLSGNSACDFIWYKIVMIWDISPFEQ